MDDGRVRDQAGVHVRNRERDVDAARDRAWSGVGAGLTACSPTRCCRWTGRGARRAAWRRRARSRRRADSLIGDGPTGSPSSRGIVSRKAAPSPLRPAAESVPPCRPTSSCAIDRPSPVPPVVRVRAVSPRQKRSNTRSACSSDMPTPWSRTSTATVRSSDATERSTGLPSECSIALTRRLRTTRSIRRASTSAVQLGVRRCTVTRAPFRSASSSCPSATPWTSSAMSVGPTSRMAAPASNREISSRSAEHVVEPLDLGHEQLGRARDRRREVLALVVDEVRRHADRRQRRAQLVADVGDDRCWSRESSDMSLICAAATPPSR